MDWIEIVSLITGIASVIAIFVSVYAILKSQRTNQVNVLKENNDKFIDDLYTLLGCFDSEIALSIFYILENVVGDLINKKDFADESFNNFKIYISDILRNAKLYQLKIISEFNSYIDKKNEYSIDLCGDVITRFYLTNYNFYRMIEDYIDALTVIVRQKGDFMILKDQAMELVDNLCELYFVERIYFEFVSNFSMHLRKSVQDSKIYSIKKVSLKAFEQAYKFLCKLGLVENDGSVTSNQLKEVQQHIEIIKTTRRENLLYSLDVYNEMMKKNNL